MELLNDWKEEIQKKRDDPTFKPEKEINIKTFFNANIRFLTQLLSIEFNNKVNIEKFSEILNKNGKYLETVELIV